MLYKGCHNKSFHNFINSYCFLLKYLYILYLFMFKIFIYKYIDNKYKYINNIFLDNILLVAFNIYYIL